MNNPLNLPIIFTHYGVSPYLKYTLALAKLKNSSKRCILLGDETNKELAELYGWEHYLASTLDSSKRRRFNEVFQVIKHPAYANKKGSVDWIKYVSERFYALEVFVKSQGIQYFWHFDSDTMIVSDLGQHEEHLVGLEIACTTQCCDSCLNGFVESSLLPLFTQSMIDDFLDAQFMSEMRRVFETDNAWGAFTEMRAFVRFRQKSSVKTKHLAQLFAFSGVYFDDALCLCDDMEMTYLPFAAKRAKTLLGQNTNFFGFKGAKKLRFATLNCSWLPETVYEAIFMHSMIGSDFEMPFWRDAKFYSPNLFITSWLRRLQGIAIKTAIFSSWHAQKLIKNFTF